MITLVGLNESGKTTILDALAYFRPGIDDPDPLILMELARADPNDLIPIASKSNFNGVMEINCGVELNDDDETALLKYLKDEHAFRCTDIPRNLTVIDKYKFADSVWDGKRGAFWDFRPRGMLGRSRKETILHNSSNGQIWLDAINFLRKRMPRVWYFPNFLFDFSQRIYLEEKDPGDSIERFYRKLIGEILATVDAGATVERHIVQRIKSENSAELRALEQLLILVGRQVTQDVFGSWNEIFNRPQSTKAMVKPSQDEDGYCYIEISIEDSDGLYYISERSLGFRWFFVFSLVTRYAGLDKGKPDVVFLFDEPASNLHAGAQSQLLGSLAKLSESSTIVYTTHSHHLINPVWLENTYVVRNKGFDFDTSISDYTARRTDITIERYRSFATNHPNQTRYFQPILDVLEYRPSQLEMVPDVVLVEGKNDYYTLAYMKQYFGQTFAETKFVPCNGAGSLDYIIRLYLGWAKNFIVFFDSDKGGEREKKRYRTALGSLVDGRLCTLADFDEKLKGHALEQVFEQSDRDAIIEAVTPGEPYDKVRFNRSIQECLAVKKIINMSPATIGSFEHILNQLSQRLSKASNL